MLYQLSYLSLRPRSSKGGNFILTTSILACQLPRGCHLYLEAGVAERERPNRVLSIVSIP